MSDSTQNAGQENTAPPAQGDNQAQAPETLLTAKPAEGEAQIEGDVQGQPAADPNAEADPSKDGEGDAKEDEQKGPPEKYELKAPEGFESIDPVLVEQFEPVARELGLSNEAAQRLVETQMPKIVERITEQHREAWGKQLEQWVETVKTDKEIGGQAFAQSTKYAQTALAKFGTPELMQMLAYPSAENPNGLGLGNNPELVRVFARIGKAMADDRIVTGSTKPGDRKGGLYSDLPPG